MFLIMCMNEFQVAKQILIVTDQDPEAFDHIEPQNGVPFQAAELRTREARSEPLAAICWVHLLSCANGILDCGWKNLG